VIIPCKTRDPHFFYDYLMIISASPTRRMYVILCPANILMVEQCHPSPSGRFRFWPVPATALEPGPQFGGFCWYLTSLTLEEGVDESGCLLKFAAVLCDRQSSVAGPDKIEAHFGSFERRRCAGEFSPAFWGFTGCSFTQERYTS
jgi:hypothetical protein